MLLRSREALRLPQGGARRMSRLGLSVCSPGPSSLCAPTAGLWDLHAGSSRRDPHFSSLSCAVMSARSFGTWRSYSCGGDGEQGAAASGRARVEAALLLRQRQRGRPRHRRAPAFAGAPARSRPRSWSAAPAPARCPCHWAWPAAAPAPGLGSAARSAPGGPGSPGGGTGGGGAGRAGGGGRVDGPATGAEACMHKAQVDEHHLQQPRRPHARQVHCPITNLHGRVDQLLCCLHPPLARVDAALQLGWACRRVAALGSAQKACGAPDPRRQRPSAALARAHSANSVPLRCLSLCADTPSSLSRLPSFCIGRRKFFSTEPTMPSMACCWQMEGRRRRCGKGRRPSADRHRPRPAAARPTGLSKPLSTLFRLLHSVASR